MSPVRMYHFILLVAWITLGGSWPMSHVEHKLDLIIARDSHAVGSPTTNGSTITARTITLAKEINTTLAGLVVLLTIGTYWFLMRYTPTLSSEIILPSKLLEDNISAVLSLTWPKHFTGPQNEINYEYPYNWVLFHKLETGEVVDGRPVHQILGFDDFKEGIKDLEVYETGKSPILVVKAFSPIMKSLVQIAIWNYVSIWLVLVMIVNTLFYNGFLSHGITNDSVLRLILVGVYAVASIGHCYRTTTLLYRNFTFVLFQTCWTIICKQFIFGNIRDYESYTMDQQNNDNPKSSRDHPDPDSSKMIWRSFDSQLFGTMEGLDTYQDLTEGKNAIDPRLRARDKNESKFDKFVKPIREAEIKAFEKATDSALEKTLANVAVLIAICLATALAPWNSAQTTSTTSATSAQLGSYALLLSTSTGFLALVSSITQLTNAVESARTLLLLQEQTIVAHIINDETRDVSNNFWPRDVPDFSLSKDIEGRSQFESSSLWRLMSFLDKLLCLLLGPALMLVPRMHRIEHHSSEHHGSEHHGPEHHGSELLTIKVQGIHRLAGPGGLCKI